MKSRYVLFRSCIQKPVSRSSPSTVSVGGFDFNNTMAHRTDVVNPKGRAGTASVMLNPLNGGLLDVVNAQILMHQAGSSPMSIINPKQSELWEIDLDSSREIVKRRGEGAPVRVPTRSDSIKKETGGPMDKIT